MLKDSYVTKSFRYPYFLCRDNTFVSQRSLLCAGLSVINFVYVLVMLDAVHRKVNRIYYVLRNCKLLVYAVVVRFFFSFIIIIIQLKSRMHRFFRHWFSTVYVLFSDWKGRGMLIPLVSCWASNSWEIGGASSNLPFLC